MRAIVNTLRVFALLPVSLCLTSFSPVDINFIRIRPETDAPAFSHTSHTLALTPGLPVGSLIGRVSAIDHQGDAMTYSITGEAPFVIDASGDIRTTELLNHNATQRYDFQVEAGDGLHSSTTQVTARFVLDAGTRVERWLGVSGDSVDDLLASTHYQNDAADVVDTGQTLEVGDSGTSNFGQRLSAVIVPVTTGDYVFGLTSDDGSQAWMAADGNDQNLVSILRRDSWTGFRNWASAAVTIPIPLRAGHAYCVEILHKEGGGGDHVSLGWKFEGASDFSLIPESEVFQGYLTPELAKPVFSRHETEHLIPGATATGETVATVAATDSQGDSIIYNLVGVVPFAIDQEGTVTVASPLPAAGGDYTFQVTASDGTHTVASTWRVRTTSDTAVEDALTSGSVAAVTSQELLGAAIASIQDGQSLQLDSKTVLFDLNPDGTARSDGTSLTAIGWDPTHDAAILKPTFGMNTPVLFTNSVTDVTKTVMELEIGVIGEAPGRHLVLGGNPMRNAYRDADSVNSQMHQFLENSIAWLTGRNDLQTSPFNVVIAHMDQSYYFPDEVAVRSWLDDHYPTTVSYNDADTADDGALVAALATEPDLLIISQIGGDDPAAVAAAVEDAMGRGIGVLYLHHDGNLKSLGEALFSVFRVRYDGDNYWKRLQLTDYDITQVLAQGLPADVDSIHTMLNHFQAGDYAFDWSTADGENVDAVGGLQSEFLDGASEVRSIFSALDAGKLDIFGQSDYRLQKLLALLGDRFREVTFFPMDKEITSDTEFLMSYFADHAVYNYRAINPVQPDMGNFSRSDFSHISPVARTIDLESKRNFRSAGVYALPGQTVSVTRLDDSEVTVKVFVNTQRSGSTHQWATWGYKRPKYLKSPSFEIATGETIQFTSPYGGPLQMSFGTNDLPVKLHFENVGEHPYWRGSQDNEEFSRKLAEAEYDWAEIATPAFEVHSTLPKMIESVDTWGTAADLAAATMRYIHNFPHVLAGFQGPGIDVVDEVHGFADANGWTINAIDLVKHMNADQATCGYGCSGNPYDAYWNFSPTGHGDVHELGHGLESGRFRLPGWEGHSTTNPYSYYTKTQYGIDTGNDPGCQSLPFEAMFDALQGSVPQGDPATWLDANLWTDSNWSHQVGMLIQIMMLAQDQGALENGWHVLPRLHILEREFERADNNDDDWLAKRDFLGFSTYTRTEAREISNLDWMVIAVSYVTGMDFREFFTMYGYAPGAKAEAQVAGFSSPAAPRLFYLSTGKGYCEGQGFNAMSLPVDGSQVWPDETDTDGDQIWDHFDPDDDDDGMPDTFETSNGFDPFDAGDAGRDADLDGMTNAAEQIAGTDPRDASSVFRIQDAKPGNNGMDITWSSVPGLRYEIHSSDDLESGFTFLDGPFDATGDTLSTTDTRPHRDTRFYRIQVESP